MDAFKPSKKAINNDKIVISIRMDINKINEIDKIASKVDISRNELIKQCINYALANIEFDDKNFVKEKEL